MHAALEVCGEFLSRIGALEGANAIAEILLKTGAELPETSPFRWRALLAAIRQELDTDPMDVVFLLERLLQLDATTPSGTSHALFESPLFLHILVGRFAVAFEGLDAEIFKLESDKMCHAEDIFETCLLIQNKIGGNEGGSGLAAFLESFKRIFEQDEPKDCWDAFYEFHRLSNLTFRRDMKRALCVIESVILGPTKLELAFPTESADKPKIVVPRALLEKRFGGTRQEWQDLSQIYSITKNDGGCASNGTQEEEEQEQPQEQTQEQEQPQAQEQTQEQAQEQEQETQTLTSTGNTVAVAPRLPAESSDVNGETTESVHSDISEEAPAPKRSVSSRPPRAADVARGVRQEGRRTAPRTKVPRQDNDAGEPVDRVSSRRKRVRWSAEEEAALIEGYRLYESYSNVWVLIKTKYPVVLQNRSNVQLKDKYRNLVRYGRISQATNDNAGVTDDDVTDDNVGVVDKNDTA